MGKTGRRWYVHFVVVGKVDTYIPQMNESLYNLRNDAFSKDSLPSSRLGIGFGARLNDLGMEILRVNAERLPTEWESCVRRLVRMQLAVEDELKRMKDTAVSHFCKDPPNLCLCD